MRIGLTYTLRQTDQGAGAAPNHSDWSIGALDDAQEELDAPETIAALTQALESLGHEVERLGDGPPLVARLARGDWPELVFNLAEGSGSERTREARVPALLELLGIPYTGSDPLTLAATLDKDCGKRLVGAAGVATPAWTVCDGSLASVDAARRTVPFPVFVKPAYEGSSKGIIRSSVIDEPAELGPAVAALQEAYRQPVLVEEFIAGDELTVGLVGGAVATVLGILRVLPRTPVDRFIYSLEVKRNWRQAVCYECPAQLDPVAEEAVRRAAVLAWEALGCRDVARIDFRLRGQVPYFLECNPLPGLSPESGDLVLLAQGMGIGYRELLDRILQSALARRAPQIQPAMTCG
jgi:D-alanine-D-alanine ligase